MERALYGAHVSPKYGEYAGHIHSAGLHLLNIVNDVLDISKIEAGQMEVCPEWLETPVLARDAAALFSTRALTAGIDLSIEIAAPRVFADRRAAHQILLNVLSNAVKFTPQGGRIGLAVRAVEGGVEIAVSDTGCGIPEQALPSIFDPFVQTDNCYQRSKGGTGLGLALVRSLARLHGGEARIESVLGQGTTVRVWFPDQQIQVAAA